MSECGWLEAKENLTEDKVPMLTAVQLFTGGEGHFHAWCSLFLYLMSCHVILQGCLHRKITGKRHSIPPYYLVVFQRYYFKGGFLNRICGFHLVIERNGYFVYFSFVVQTFCNKNHDETHWTVPRMTTSAGERFIFLIGTENVKQNHIVLNETKQKWRQVMRNKWANASEMRWWLTITLWGAGWRKWACTLPKYFNYALHNHKIKLAMR